MERPLHLVAVLAVLCMAEPVSAAEENGPQVPKRERPISPRIAEMLAATAPKFEPVPGYARAKRSETGLPETAPRLPESQHAPANGIVRLPDYIVRERKPRELPSVEDVMLPRQLEKLAMQEFLGDEQGLDRALNTLTVAHLWKKIPVLGRFPFNFVTNEERAMALYRADREAKKWAELGSLLSPELRTEAQKSPPRTPASPSTLKK
jgi:hypothetical protein